MKLKNIGDKIVNIGTTVVMPGAEISISEKQAMLPSIGVLIARKLVAVEEDPAEKVAEAPVVEEAVETAEPEEAVEKPTRRRGPKAKKEE